MKSYFLRFGAGDPRVYAGLAPTFLIFKDSAGTNVTSPSIAEVGTTTGLYTFSWGTTTPIVFLADAATTSPGLQGRYVVGGLDPADRSDEYGNTLVAIGTTNVAIGTTLTGIIPNSATLVALGNTAIALGTTNVAIGTTTQAIATTLLAQGTSLTVTVAGIGSTASSFGDSTTDPIDLFGYMKRIQELMEGNETFIKTSGSLTMYSRGSSVTLRAKTVANSVSTVVKS
jgi:hypothetical protein